MALSRPLYSLQVTPMPPYDFSDVMGPLHPAFMNRVNQRLSLETNQTVAKDGIVQTDEIDGISEEMILTSTNPDYPMLQVVVLLCMLQNKYLIAFCSQDFAMSAQRFAFAQSRRIEHSQRGQVEFRQLPRGGKFPLNIHRLSDQAQRIMLGHAFPDGSVNAEDIAQFRSQPADFHANCRAISAQATAELLGDSECASFYAGTTLFVVKKGLTVLPFFPIDIPAYGPSRGIPLSSLSADELLAHATLSSTGAFVNDNPVCSGYLARALFVESNLTGNEYFLENPQRCDGIFIDRRKSILTVEPQVGLGMGLALYFERDMLERNRDEIIIPKGMVVASLCGQV